MVLSSPFFLPILLLLSTTLLLVRCGDLVQCSAWNTVARTGSYGVNLPLSLKTNFDGAASLATNLISGDIYVTGEYVQGIELRFPTLNNQRELFSIGGITSCYILKIDTLGRYIWLNSIGKSVLSTSDYALAKSIRHSPSRGEVVVAGHFRGSIYFSSNITLSAKVETPFLAFYNETTGEVKQAIPYSVFQDSTDESARFIDMELDIYGNIIVVGSAQVTDVKKQAIVAKMSPTGALLWKRKDSKTDKGITLDQYYLDVSLSNNDGIVAVGVVIDNGVSQALYRKFSGAGLSEWEYKTDNKQSTTAMKVGTFDGNQFYIMGQFKDSLHFDNTTLNTTSATVYLAKISQDSKAGWLKQLPIVTGAFRVAATKIVFIGSNGTDLIGGEVGTNGDIKQTDVVTKRLTGDTSISVQDIILDKNDNEIMVGNYFGKIQLDTDVTFESTTQYSTLIVRYALNCGCKTEACKIPLCNGQTPWDPQVCGGNGFCVAPNTCHCAKGYTGNSCQFPVCYGQTMNQACSGKGTCIYPDTCLCKDGFAGERCNIPSCFGIQAMSPKACSEHGMCVREDRCVCEYGYAGEMCEKQVIYRQPRICEKGIERLGVAPPVQSKMFVLASHENITADASSVIKVVKVGASNNKVVVAGNLADKVLFTTYKEVDRKLVSDFTFKTEVDGVEITDFADGPTPGKLSMCGHVNLPNGGSEFFVKEYDSNTNTNWYIRAKSQSDAPDATYSTKCYSVSTSFINGNEYIVVTGTFKGSLDLVGACESSQQSSTGFVEQGYFLLILTNGKCTHLRKAPYSGLTTARSVMTQIGLVLAFDFSCSTLPFDPEFQPLQQNGLGSYAIMRYFNKGSITSKISWMSAPIPYTPPTLKGEIHVKFLSVDPLDFIVVGGTFKGVIGFNDTLTVGSMSYQEQNIFLAKYDSNGEIIWVKAYSSPNFNNDIRGITVNEFGVVHVAGTFAKSLIEIDLDTNPTILSTSSSVPAVYVLQLTPYGKMTGHFSVTAMDANSFVTVDAITERGNETILGLRANGQIAASDGRVASHFALSDPAVLLLQISMKRPECVPCEAGSYTNSSNADICIKCDPGQIVDGSACKTCPFPQTATEDRKNCHIPVVTLVVSLSAAAGFILMSSIICTIVILVAILCIIVKVLKKKARRSGKKYGGFQALLDGMEEPAEGKRGSKQPKFTIDSSMFTLSFNDLSDLKEIGSGGSGSIVYCCKWNSEIVAVKVFRTTFFTNETQFAEFENELKLISSLRHKNILNFYAACLELPLIGICMEYCEKGTLRSVIGAEAGSISISRKIKILMDIARGMLYLHSKGVIHRDLKSDNILLDQHYVCKVSDFGLSKMKTHHQQQMTMRVGTSAYLAPEVTLGRFYDEKCDVYSFAIILFEILFETMNPYPATTTNIELQVAQNPSFRPQIPAEFPIRTHEDIQQRLVTVMKQCWQQEPADRPSFTEIVNTLEEMATEMRLSQQ